MSDHHTYEEEVSNWTGAEGLTLQIVKREDVIGIGLSPSAGGTPLKCELQIAEAEAVVLALKEAIKLAKSEQ